MTLAVLVASGCGEKEKSQDPPTGSDSGPDPVIPVVDAAAPVDVQPVRFVAMGDAGTGSESQYKVAAEVAKVCEQRGCDFILLLGDNVYDAGVDSVEDPLWQEVFELPYAVIPEGIPFYPVLGNHDYGGKLATVDTGGLGNEFEKGSIAVEYSNHSDKWMLPATFYTLKVRNVGFMMLDTNAIIWSDTTYGDQAAWYASARAELNDADWVFAAGHHPYRSNGRHGNAGSYESIEVGGVEVPNPFNSLNGQTIKDFFDVHVCGTVDAYFSGHDHNLQWLDEPGALCGAELVVSGAGAKVTAFKLQNNSAFYQDDQKPGFVYAEVDGDTLTMEFIDEDGELDFSKSVSRQ